MIEIIAPSLYILTGVCLYSCFSHFSMGIQRPYNHTQIFFACVTLWVTLFAIFQVPILKTAQQDEFVLFLKCSITLGIALCCNLVWFIAFYTRKIPWAVCIAYTVYSGVALLVNLLQPYSLQFQHLNAIKQMQLPWGELMNYASGDISNWFRCSALVLLSCLFYLLYILVKHYRSNRIRANLGMLLAMGVLLICVTQAMLVRLGLIHFVPLGIYGYLGMVMTMSLILFNENHQKLILASQVYEASNEGMIVTNGDNKIIAVNPAFTQATGYTQDEVLGLNPRFLKSGRHDGHFYQQLWEDVLTHGKWQGEIWNKRKNGEIFPEWLSISTLYNLDRSVNMWIALFRDITKEKQSDELIWQQANYDELTGLLNRRSFNERLSQQIKKSVRFSMSTAVILIDLDRFKETNDALGHDVGDLLLKEAAQRMTACIRNTDILGRLGGDEFVIVLGELENTSMVGQIASKLLDKLSAAYCLGEDRVYSSASIGITLFPDDATDIARLMRNADQAMYAAKRQGRNCFHFYTPAMQAQAETRRRLSRDLHIALPENQFRVYFQPIVELQSGAIRKAEALIRWQHPELGLVSPADFIPIAEETGQIVEIGDWVFNMAAAETARLRTNYDPDFQISINKSPVQFKNNTNNHREWFETLQALGLPGQSVVIEITEGILMEAKQEINSHLLTFRDNGVQVALDDFGTGYSSLAYLQKFDIDYIKIDQAFVKNLLPNSNDMALCEAMVVMAHKLGLKVIAEGVETALQRDLLKQISCDYAQGYYFSKPLPVESFEAFLGSVSLGEDSLALSEP